MSRMRHNTSVACRIDSRQNQVPQVRQGTCVEAPTPASAPSPAPSQIAPQPQPQANQPDGASPFDSLPSFGSPAASGQPGIGLPAAQPPAQLSSHASPATPAYRQPQAGHLVNGPNKKKNRTSKSSPLKIALIIGGIIGGLGILGCAGLIGLAVLGARSQSGWQTITQQGVTVQLPAGRVKESSKSNSASTGSSFRVGSRQTGSVFGLQIIDMRIPPPPGLSLEEVMKLGGTVFSDTRPVSRDGRHGFHGTVVSSKFTEYQPALKLRCSNAETLSSSWITSLTRNSPGAQPMQNHLATTNENLTNQMSSSNRCSFPSRISLS